MIISTRSFLFFAAAGSMSSDSSAVTAQASTPTHLRGQQPKEQRSLQSEPERGNYHYKLSQQDWTNATHGRLKITPNDLPFNMQFGEVELFPGGVRDLHWHRKAAEWGYVSAGICEFTLMDDHNRYVNGVANTGDVYYFPLGWQHSIQGIDPDVGCTLLIWFDDQDGAGSINLSDMMAAYPKEIVQASLNGIPEEALLAFPKGTNAIGFGRIQDEKIEPSDHPLDLWPVFPVKKGEITESGEGGVEYDVRQEQLLATLTMSGALIELEEGTMRELHWHTNADEHHYVLSGKVRNIVHSNIGGIESTEEYIIEKGDVGYVPLNFVHYLEAVDGPATVVVTFNHPSWGTQGLSAMMAVTPTYVTASVLNTTTDIADTYFPKESTAFLKKLPPSNASDSVEDDAGVEAMLNSSPGH